MPIWPGLVFIGALEMLKDEATANAFFHGVGYLIRLAIGG
ncbi:hypothetical protein DNHGIG_23670 [Collibacillus ludicampi]|jgi:hypothetical protein|uniref:Uncharacterized protein n=1 Tax=Collibacillus ludicampi TaxID=2771369 RepID=A0AAV4LGH7_9BACL|nr:hypothetical protein DNHGIG_23670 [Collibacillus ludicampi]